MSLYDLSKRDASEDVFELVGVEAVVTTPEQLAKAREKFSDMQGSMQLKVTWRPKTYRKFIGDEEVTEEVDYIKMTTSGAITDQNIGIIRDGKLRAINKGMLIALPNKPDKADPDKQPQEYSRFMVAALKAGLVIEPTEDGGVTSPQIGKLFRCRSGYEEFPRPGEDAKGGFKWDWDDTRSTFMRVPVALVTDFVEPADEDKREFRYERRDDDSTGGAATTTTSGGGVTEADLAAAIRAIGISGKPVSLIDQNGLAIVTSQVAQHRALALIVGDVQSKSLSEVLVDRGLATVADGTLVVN